MNLRSRALHARPCTVVKEAQMFRALVIPGALLVSAALLACGGGGEEESSNGDGAASSGTSAAGTKVVAVLKEFSIEPDKTSAPAGSVSFDAQNKGTTPHELKIVKTDLAPDKLPVKDGKVDEGAVQILAKSAEFAAGQNQTVTASLTAGRYVLICNVVAHYPAGMHIAFAVE
jgi:uncharacterized cupredoxin-like copper-binding protein